MISSLSLSFSPTATHTIPYSHIYTPHSRGPPLALSSKSISPCISFNSSGNHAGYCASLIPPHDGTTAGYVRIYP